MQLSCRKVGLHIKYHVHNDESFSLSTQLLFRKGMKSMYVGLKKKSSFEHTVLCTDSCVESEKDFLNSSTNSCHCNALLKKVQMSDFSPYLSKTSHWCQQKFCLSESCRTGCQHTNTQRIPTDRQLQIIATLIYRHNSTCFFLEISLCLSPFFSWKVSKRVL